MIVKCVCVWKAIFEFLVFESKGFVLFLFGFFPIVPHQVGVSSCSLTHRHGHHRWASGGPLNDDSFQQYDLCNVDNGDLRR